MVDTTEKNSGTEVESKEETEEEAEKLNRP